MAKTYVHIHPIVTSGNKEAAAALKRGLKKKLLAALSKAVAEGLPNDYSIKLNDRPKTKDKYNAIKATPQLKLIAEQKGHNLKVSCNVRMEFEAIKWPKTRPGSLLAAGSKGGAVANRGSGDGALEAFTKDILAATATPFTKSTLSNKAFKRKAADLGLQI